jgi:hypothetical protein
VREPSAVAGSAVAFRKQSKRISELSARLSQASFHQIKHPA